MAKSYLHGVSTKNLVGKTIGQCLNRIAEVYPGQPAVISRQQEIRFTYGEFRKVVDRAALALMNLGIERGDRVAIWSTNNYEWVTAQYATAKVGAILVNINPAYRTHELEYVLRESRAKMLLLIESFKSSNYLDMFYEVCPEARTCEPGHVESFRFPNLKSVVFIGSEHHPGMLTRREFAELGDVESDQALIERESSLDCDDVINIQYTSGTTGFPKGVQLTHHNILNNALDVGRIMALASEDRVCVPVPFYHCFGMVISNLAAMAHGAAVVIPSPAFDASATLKAIHQERCTVLHGVPTMFLAQLDHPEFSSFNLGSLRTGIMAGAPCPIELMRRVVEQMNIKHILIAYGQTEASPVTTLTRPNDSLEQRVSTVGTVMPNQELKIIDPDTGSTVDRNTQGEICFRGYCVMRGYDNDPDATSNTIDDSHWLHSGDLGEMDDDGYVKITGRIKDMVIRGGENLYPREIEEFLLTLPVIADAYVVGIPDKKYGEELLACVTLRDSSAEPPSSEQFRDMCKGKIAHFKIPRYWMPVEEFPMTVTGKVQKFRIRELAIKRLNIDGGTTVQTDS